MWNQQRVSVVNQILANAQNDGEQHDIQHMQWNSLPSITKDPKKISRQKG